MRKTLQSSLSTMLLLLTLLLVGCKPGVPGEYIQPGKMEAILYDYHLAQGILQQQSAGTDYSKHEKAYKLSVLRKHGVTESEFEASLQYYMRHTERLQDIYERLAERLEEEALAQGASVSDINSYDAMTAKGDTANIWAGERAFVLSPYAPYHLNTFSFKADTAFHRGDRLMFSFDSQFIVQEGSRSATAVLAVRFANDSIASQMQNLTNNMHHSLTIEDRQQQGIKEVKGYILFSRNQNDAVSALRLLFVTNVQLIRVHQKNKSEAPQGATESADTAKAKENADNRDSVRAPHRPMRMIQKEPSGGGERNVNPAARTQESAARNQESAARNQEAKP